MEQEKQINEWLKAQKCGNCAFNDDTITEDGEETCIYCGCPKPKDDMMKSEVFGFSDDTDKMKDFVELSKKDFLKSYSYLTEKEYDQTLIDLQNMELNREIETGKSDLIVLPYSRIEGSFDYLMTLYEGLHHEDRLFLYQLATDKQKTKYKLRFEGLIC